MSNYTDYKGRHTGKEIDDAVDRVARGVASQAVFVNAVMESAGWTGNTYSFEDTYPSTAYDISIEVSPAATAEQFEAFGGAMICGSAEANIATALGSKPSMDVPIIIKVVAK